MGVTRSGVWDSIAAACGVVFVVWFMGLILGVIGMVVLFLWLLIREILWIMGVKG